LTWDIPQVLGSAGGTVCARAIPVCAVAYRSCAATIGTATAPAEGSQGALLALSGCNRAQPPAEVQADVATATNAAISNNTEAGADQMEVAKSANKDLNDAALEIAKAKAKTVKTDHS
jgi:hypothetical protein